MSVPTVYFLLKLYFAAINIAALCMFGYDKYLTRANEKAAAKARAKSSRTGKRTRAKYRRVPEAYLLAVAFLGGSFGSLVGIRFFKYDSKKRFNHLILLFLALQTIALLILTMGL